MAGFGVRRERAAFSSGRKTRGRVIWWQRECAGVLYKVSLTGLIVFFSAMRARFPAIISLERAAGSDSLLDSGKAF